MSPLDRLVAGLFDYAGLCPPAALPFDEALRTSARLRLGLRRPGMVASDFVCGLERLDQVTAGKLAEAGWSPSRPFKVCVLGPPLAGPGSPKAAEQTAAVARAGAFGGRDLLAASYEAKCPVDCFGYRALKGLEALREGLGGFTLGLYVEPECSADAWDGALEKIFRFFDGLPPEQRPGLKLRCSGPAAMGPEELARALAAALERGLRIKIAAGLHGAVAEEARGEQVGFLGISLAVRLRRALGPGFSVPAMAGCMTARDPGQFAFEEGAAAWLGFRLDPGELPKRPALTIEACGLREPDDELARLFPGQGWLADSQT